MSDRERIAAADVTRSSVRRVRVLKVGTRTYRKRSAVDRRFVLEYSVPELRLSNAWLEAAGFAPGDRAAVSSPEPGFLVVSRLPKAREPHQAAEGTPTAPPRA